MYENMTYLKIDKETNYVTLSSEGPFYDGWLGKTIAELELEGIFVEVIPEPERIEGKTPNLKGKIETKELWYEYVDKSKTQEEILQDTISALGQTVAEEKIKSMQKDALISSLGQELTKVKLEMMQLKGGM